MESAIVTWRSCLTDRALRRKLAMAKRLTLADICEFVIRWTAAWRQCSYAIASG